jgi:hypothetical protein
MTQSWNLDQDSEAGFGFRLNSNDYFFRYPTLEEVDEFSKLPEDKQLDAMYEFIETRTPEAPSIKEALSGANIKVVQKFMEMVQTEFAGAK